MCVTKKTTMKISALISVFALALSGCATEAAGTLENGDPEEIEIAVFNGWPEGIAASQVWRAALEDQGYDVTLTEADPAPVYSGLASGDYDVVLDTWMPDTHEDYIEEYGDDLEDLGAWYSGARNTMVVNEDAPITSLSELSDHADEFDNQIIGLEPGAGLTQMTEESVIPTYGLENLEFVASSTPALLGELEAAVDSGENFVGTLARPYWAFEAYPIRELEDPENAYGEDEEIRVTARGGFSEDFPAASAWLEDFQMDDDHLLPLCNELFNLQEDRDPADVTDEWLEENQEWFESLTS